MIKTSLLFLLTMISGLLLGQDYRWQQQVEYQMQVKLDVKSHRLTGTQKLKYFNNSPDTLNKVYYHLYFNAFQPGSMMDVRSRNLSDPDPRVADRISKLSPSEVGFQHVLSLKQDGMEANHFVYGTILEVSLPRPIPPRSVTTFDMEFESQVPLQIRRSGFDNKEGIAFSMTQWYPKMAEYDFQGWHAYQYVAREFHAPWGKFDVSITLDPTFIVAGTGILTNPEKVGYGYEKGDMKVIRPQGDLTWHFVAKDVIDFAWAADPDYTHEKAQVANGPELHFFYQKNEKTITPWKEVQTDAVKVFEYLNAHFGKYPFSTYSIIQGGDGAMEYPMCTLIMGDARSMAHEVTHSWYQMALASNESLYAWMDEGFTDFASSEARASFSPTENPHAVSYRRYFALVASGLQEPASQASDHFSTNRAYSTAAYAMGEIFLNQLRYILGDVSFNKGMLLYFNTWKMRHPEPNDFIRIMEKVSGLQLHWYLRYWIGTIKRIDYGINSVTEQNGSVTVSLDRAGELPMPIDLVATYADGSRELFYITMNEMMGSKPVDDKDIKRTDLPAWNWVSPNYTFSILRPMAQVVSLEIDPSQRMADVNQKNNTWKAPVK